MTAQPAHNNKNKDLYKRLLRRSATTSALDLLTEPFTGRLSTRLNEAFKEAEYSFQISFEEYKMKFDFSDGAGQNIIFGIGPKNKTPVAATVIDIAEAKKIVDLMLGADPEVEMIVDYTPMVPIQQAIFQEFGVVLADTMRTVFKADPFFDAKITDEKRLEAALEDLVAFETVLKIDDFEVRFTFLISQKQLLKLQVRQSDDSKTKTKQDNDNALPFDLVPDRNIELNIEAVVAVPAMTLVDVANLRIGDRLAINESPASETLLLVNGHKMHRGKIGQDNGSYALLVEDAYQPMQSIVNATQQ